MKITFLLVLVFTLISACSGNSSTQPVSGDADFVPDLDNQSEEPDIAADNVMPDTDDILADSTETDEDEQSVTDSDVSQKPSFPRLKSGEIVLFKQMYGGVASKDPYVKADFWNRNVVLDAFAPYAEEIHEEILTDGVCTIYKAAMLACETPCEWDEYCSTGGICLKRSVRANAGKIVVSFPGGESVLEASDSNNYYGSVPPESFATGNTFTFSAAGGDIPAFTLSAKVPADFTFSSAGGDNTIALFDDKDTVLTWTPVPDAFVRVVLNNGWHGTDPDATMYCLTDAAAGELVISRTISMHYPVTAGSGLEPHNSFVELFTADIVEHGSSIVDLVISYRAGVYPKHE